MKKIMTKPESKLNLEVYKLYPYLLKLHNGPVFSESSADFSADSFFDLYLDFLNIYIVLLYSINTFLKSDKLKDSTGRKASYFFQKDNEIKNFEKISNSRHNALHQFKRRGIFHVSQVSKIVSLFHDIYFFNDFSSE